MRTTLMFGARGRANGLGAVTEGAPQDCPVARVPMLWVTCGLDAEVPPINQASRNISFHSAEIHATPSCSVVSGTDITSARRRVEEWLSRVAGRVLEGVAVVDWPHLVPSSERSASSEP